MKFKSDSGGWRDLKFTRDGAELQVSVPDRKSDEPPQDANPLIFIKETDGTDNACISLTRKELRRLAYKILKELDR